MRRAKNSAHPESASFAGAVRGASPNFGIPAQRVPKFLPLPARPAGGRAVTDVGLWAAGQAKKKEDPRRVPPTRKGGSREEEPLPPWCSFLRLSSKESRAPARGRAGNGALRPEVSEKPRPPKGYAVPPSRSGRPGPHQTAPSFFAQFCATFLPPPCTPACNFGPGSPGGERRFCHAHPP